MNEKRMISFEVSIEYLVSYARSVGRLQHSLRSPYDEAFLTQMLKQTGPLDAESCALLAQAYAEGYGEGDKMESDLSDVRDINQAIWDNVNGHNNGVYAVLSSGDVVRINQAKIVSGLLEVHAPYGWIAPVRVYKV
ncbi:hypothetical protein [Tengunoibacter tsumagoiensis]|uniref:Uncharacterized protein n=1 Tax=Tengunoibacter tsumagoiensis TaxID=2014871 RepID=A0A401ZZ63_9CHLR|nr:hypothetical protein [Tengunoibacter tsumagoiensis]GCE12112.1 hypothetical protein KTT_19710 [Tengunoibacter tsumagoiensis]